MVKCQYAYLVETLCKKCECFPGNCRLLKIIQTKKIKVFIQIYLIFAHVSFCEFSFCKKTARVYTDKKSVIGFAKVSCFMQQKDRSSVHFISFFYFREFSTTVQNRLHCRSCRTQKFKKVERLQTLQFPCSRDLRCEAHWRVARSSTNGFSNGSQD